MATRLEFSKATKLQAFQRAKGRCESCGVKLTAATGVEYDHLLRCELGGSNDFDNCGVKCSNCHAKKTYQRDIPEAAKGKRLRQAQAGIAKTRKSRPMPGSKASRWKKKMDGSVVPRD